MPLTCSRLCSRRFVAGFSQLSSGSVHGLKEIEPELCHIMISAGGYELFKKQLSFMDKAHFDQPSKT
jgi:hypothetical protein